MKMERRIWGILGVFFVLAFLVSTTSGAERAWDSGNGASARTLLASLGDDDGDDDADDADDADDDAGNDADDADNDDDGDDDVEDEDNDDNADVEDEGDEEDGDDNDDEDDGDDEDDSDDDEDDDDDVFSWQNAPEYRTLMKADDRFSEQTYQLLKKYRKASEEARPALQQSLQSLVAEHFKVRQARREYELKILQAQVQKLQAENDYRNQNAETIIKKHVDFLLQQDDGQRF